MTATWTDERRARHRIRMARAYSDQLVRQACADRAHHQATGFKKGQTAWNKGLQMGPSEKRGKTLPAEEIARRTATRRALYDGAYVGPLARGWTASDQKREKLRAAMAQRNTSGANNPAWRGGKSFEPYPSAFNRALKLGILNKQHRKCKDCQKPIGCKGGARPNVHHLDGNKWNCHPSNLVALCVSCHMKREWEVNRLRRLREGGRIMLIPREVVLSQFGVEGSVI